MVTMTPEFLGPPVLRIDRVARRFGKREVLRDISFDMQPGELVGIVGENGAGKSTLLKILVGLLPPTHGRVLIQGKLGYCPQEATVFNTLTVRENMSYFARAYGLRVNGNDDGYAERCAHLLARFEFTSYEHTLVGRLSGGTRQKLNLSLALLHTPTLLILDEPYAGFDWQTYLRFWEYAEELRSEGCSILIVSHLVYDRTRFDRLFELNDGYLRCVGVS